ncbi:MAG: SDR family NAD(P)-dependent oxidoreductase [Bacteroidetes bacterium]|jgi:3-oxoacyl-[acyl-carrier protein] reductase|nr:SDR family NAD(P)-dependent oxidoreductase [Bacteroidota bacterium]
MRLNGATAWITGAGRGIGRAIALRLAAEGATVGLTARSESELREVAEEVAKARGRAIVAPADVTMPEEVERAFRAVVDDAQRLDILVNNAGIGVFAPVTKLSLEDFDRMWSVNVRGVFLCTRLAVPIMEQQRSGTIVNISSLAGKNAFINGSGYAATKWALNGFTNCLRLEVRSSEVRVITVGPGSVATEFSSTTKDPAKLARILQPDDVASAVVAAISLPANAMMSEIDLRPTNP